MTAISPFQPRNPAGRFPGLRRLGRRCGGLLLMIALLAGAGRLALEIGVRQYPFDGRILGAVDPARVYFDREGRVIWAETGRDGAWRLPLALEEIHPDLIRATVAVEDARFWEHHGVDWIAGVRALVSNAVHGGIVSGASTLSMQLARMAAPEPRGWGAKFRQVCRAIDLERRHSKEWILAEYLNNAPYGGNLVGVEAAARFYFDKPCADLTFDQATLLAGLPQQPSRLRPDRHPERARRRQWQVLRRLADRGWLPASGAAMLTSSDLADLPISLAPGERGVGRMTRPGFPLNEGLVAAWLKSRGASGNVRSTLDPVIQSLARTAVQRHLDAIPSVSDGAVVVIENEVPSLRALIGTVDFWAQPDGQVNGAAAWRSPGSALKPFIYLSAIDQGLILPDTRLLDAALDFAGYSPGNFETGFHGWVPAREALATSLNTPAIRLLADLGSARFMDRLRSIGLPLRRWDPDRLGLSMALGGAEIRLVDLTHAYTGLANGGRFRPLKIADGMFVGSGSEKAEAEEGAEATADPPATVRAAVDPSPFHVGSVFLLNDMLRSLPLPGGSTIPVAWKTGTSNGFRDAWCFGFNTEYTVGVWIGNKDGSPAGQISGARHAAPIVGDLFTALYDHRPAPSFPAASTADLAPCALCAETGLRAGPDCPATLDASAPAGVAIRVCAFRHPEYGVPDPTQPDDQRKSESESESEAESGTPDAPAGRGGMITSPGPGAYVALWERVELPIRSVGSGSRRWFVDGKFIGRRTGEFTVAFEKGKHRVLCVDDRGNTDSVNFTVK